MDIASLSLSLADINISQQVSTKVLSNAMDMNESLGAGLVDMIDSAAMERSVNPAVGGNLDIMV